jgi:hypothetical protein
MLWTEDAPDESAWSPSGWSEAVGGDERARKITPANPVLTLRMPEVVAEVDRRKAA